MKVGVLGFQGAIEEHVDITRRALKEAGLSGEVNVVRRLEEVEVLDGLIIPGGESTVIGSMMERTGIMDYLRRTRGKFPVFGTCAGMIVLSRKVKDRVLGDTNQPTAGILDVSVERNSFGRQGDSFETELEIPAIGGLYRGVFIRAPIILDVGSEVEVLCRLNGRIVAVQQEKIMATAFHPELTDDPRIHIFFIKKIISD
ncbi:MAG: pyridoxal 5'-phosphate synthase glutaminase subunit PdxT [Candidatus Freyarchaeota archaeon]|nr:pyridoxal 5'-phosphate synthase glutaminase subunit PdxT [Candidatus Jordarchaeia archaeon]